MTSDIIKIDNISDFNYNKNTVIEASAGTGKTYTITQIVPWLLAYTNYSLSQILMVTYTEKAAGEMRSRIRKELNKILYPASEEDMEKFARLTKEIKEKISNELEKIEDAPIFTMHSFCQKILAENAIYSNCSQNMTLADEDALLEIFIGRYVRDKFAESKDKAEKKVFLYLHDNSHFSFDTILKDAIKKYYLDKNGKENEDIVSLDMLTHDEEKEYNDNVEKIINRNKTTDDQKNVGQNENIDANFVMRCFIIKHLKEIYLAWQKEKKDKNIQTYSDMIKTVHDAVTEDKSKLLEVLKRKYKYAIIDEFQDTDQLQWSIFKQIFTTDNEHHIAIVGDPKQSIYSFRGADSKVYADAKEYIKSLPNGDYKDLKVNYRSSVPMIEAINKLVMMPEFCSGFKSNKPNAQSSSEYEYTNSEVPEESKQIKPALYGVDGLEIKPVHIIENECAEDIIISKIIEYSKPSGDRTVLQIWDKDINNKNGGYRDVNFNDFAILVQKRTDAKKLITKMQKAGIPFMWHKDSTLFNTKEASDWIALLSAIVAPDFNAKNRNILHMALQTAFFEVDIGNLNNDKYDDLLCRERQILLKWRNFAETRQYAKLIDSIFEDSHITKRLASYDKIQSLSKYSQIGNIVLDYLVSKHGSIATAITMLKQRKSKGKEEDEVSVEKATNTPTVKISTIHSAKGLEFPIVFYVMLPPANDVDCFVRMVRSQQNKPILNIKKNSDKKDPDELSLKYVAITRASSLLFLINVRKKNKYKRKCAISNPLEMTQEYPEFFMIEKQEDNKNRSAEEILKELNRVSYDCGKDVKKPCEFIELKDKKLYKHSYTSLSHNKSDADEYTYDITTEQLQRIDKEDRPDSISHTLFDCASDVNAIDNIYDVNNTTDVDIDIPHTERGKQYGTIIHEIFEHLDFKMFETNDKSLYKDNLNQIIDKCCKKYSSLFVGKNIEYLRGKIISLITDTMTAELPEIIGSKATGRSFRLSSLESENKKSEIEFNLHPESEKKLLNYCNGFMDLLFVREINDKNVYSILDWKTDLLDEEDYADYNTLKSHTDKNYSIQRVLYSYCLIQWLKQFYPKESEKEIFNNHFGGIYYVYVRGCHSGNGNGIYIHPWKDYDALEKEFNTKITKGIYNE